MLHLIMGYRPLAPTEGVGKGKSKKVKAEGAAGGGAKPEAVKFAPPKASPPPAALDLDLPLAVRPAAYV
jgi:hypothetical protein